MSWAQRKPARLLGGFLAVVLLAVFAVKLFLPADKVRDMALAQARERLGREVSVGEVAVSLRGGLGVRLADFAVANPAGFGGDPLLTTAAVDLKLALRPLLRGEIRVERLVMDAPAVRLRRRADGQDNFTFAVASDAPPTAAPAGRDTSKAPPSLSVASLTIGDGSVVFIDETVAAPGLQSLRLSGLVLGLRLIDPVPGRYEFSGRLAADEVVATGPQDIPTLAPEVDFDLSWDTASSRLDLRQVALRVRDVLVDCTGHVLVQDGPVTGSMNLAVTDVAVGSLVEFLPAALAARLGDPTDGGAVSGVVKLSLTGEAERSVLVEGTATAQNIDLALAQAFLPAGQPGQLTGRAQVAGRFAGAMSDPQGLTYRGTASVSDVTFTESGLVDDLQDMQATLSFSADEIAVESCRARFGAGTVDLTGSLRDPFPYFLPPELQADREMKTPHLEFALHAARLDVDRWLPAASPTGDAAPAPRAGSDRGDAGSANELEFPDLTCNGAFTADSLLYLAVPLTAVNGQVTVRDRRLSVHDVTGSVYQGAVAGKVDIDLNDLQRPVYRGEYRATNIEVNDFATRFAGLGGVVFGGCNLHGQFAASGLDPATIRDGLTVDADAVIDQGRVVTTGNTFVALNKLAVQAGQTLDREQALRDLATHISVEQGRVHLNALSTRLGQFGDLKVDGYYGFNGDLQYNGSLLLTKAQTDQLFSGGGLGKLSKLLGARRPARLELPLTVGGTRTDPKVKLDLGAVTRDLQERAAKEQGGKLEDEAKRKLGDLLNKWK